LREIKAVPAYMMFKGKGERWRAVGFAVPH
jgi:hypothetical protein